MENHLGIGEESTWDTPVAPDVWLEIQSEQIRREPNFLPVETIRSVGPRAQSLGSVVTRGSFNAIGNYQDLPTLFYLLFGDNDTSGPVGSDYTHTVPQASAPAFVRPPLTCEVHRDEGGAGLAHKYSGCVLAELGVTVAVDELCQISGAVIGSGTEATGSPSSESYRDFDLMQPTEASFDFDTVAKNIERFTVNLQWPADEPRGLGGTILTRKPKDAGSLTVSGSFTLLEHDSAVWTVFDGYTEAALQLKFTLDASRDFEINIPNVVLNQATPALDGRTQPKPEVTWTARLDDSLITPVQLVGINQRATLP